MTKELGTLQRVDLRSVWATEDREFTPWLATDENLERLSDALGIELELEAQERNVGPFRADILCKNVQDDSWVLIENQIERTDHRHLGQLLTYAAGLDAVTIVWIASRITDEHRAALDWLNRITDEDFRFFGLEIELWQINDSIAAPKFNVVSQPNNWSKTVAQATKRLESSSHSETKLLQLRYWQELLNYLDTEGSQLKQRKPGPQHWQTFPVGKRYFHIDGVANTRGGNIKVELIIEHPEHAKDYFHLLLESKVEIEQEIGSPLEWKELTDKITSKIVLVNEADPTNEQDWKNQHAWFMKNIECFDNVFRNRLQMLDVDLPKLRQAS